MYYLSNIKGVKKFNQGVDMIIHVPDNLVYDKILDKEIKSVEIRLDDGRHISNEQRAKIFATIKDIALYTGDVPEYLRAILTYNYCAEAGIGHFSLSDCSMDTARGFINYLIEFILMHNIPLSDLAINRTNDIDAYLYYCLKYRRCSITGTAGADIHHCTGSRVGMGRDRLKIDHRNLEIIALSREWHNRVHQEGETDIFEAYKLYGIKGDTNLLERLGLNINEIS